MDTFAWTGRTRQGTVQQGERVATSREEVVTLLRKENIFATSVEKRSAGLDLSALLKFKMPDFASFSFGSSVPEKEIVIFTRQFATMIDAGLPLVQCLEILSTQSKNPILSKALKEVRADVEGGATYTDALRKHPKIFDELYVSMVSAGEIGGILDTILGRLSTHIEKMVRIKKKIKGAMVYPGITVSVALIVLTVLLVFVIPTFAKMFTDFGGSLPWLTQQVINVSNVVKSKFLIMVVAVVASGFGIKQYYQSEKGRFRIDWILLRMPVVGDLIQKAAVAKFTRTLGTLVASGVPILEGLGIVAKTSGNKVIEQALNRSRQSISEGKPISEPLDQEKVFPPMVVQMIAVGETTGALDAMLGKIADFYDDEVDASVDTLTSLLEPALMVFLGATIGTVVIAMYLPIFKLASVVG
ncbi:MAG: type II secretion system F family protein [Nitrospirae bacterium]|nr:type II secretion system F family protein [Candidatus Troglogloeales bacterium]